MHRTTGRSRRLRIAIVATIGLLASCETLASEELARAKGCFSCHAVQTKVVGPAYKDVAAKYRGQAGAEDQLVQKVLKGSSGTWGFVPMPPNTNVDADEARTLVRWILSTS